MFNVAITMNIVTMMSLGIRDLVPFGLEAVELKVWGLQGLGFRASGPQGLGLRV